MTDLIYCPELGYGDTTQVWIADYNGSFFSLDKNDNPPDRMTFSVFTTNDASYCVFHGHRSEWQDVKYAFGTHLGMYK